MSVSLSLSEFLSESLSSSWSTVLFNGLQHFGLDTSLHLQKILQDISDLEQEHFLVTHGSSDAQLQHIKVRISLGAANASLGSGTGTSVSIELSANQPCDVGIK